MQQPINLLRPSQSLLPISLLLIGFLSGCSHPLVFDGAVGQSLAETTCIDRCQASKDKCDDDARYDYQQCQAGYSASWRSRRFCESSSFEPDQCGYPWWPCSQNLYGYCSNRYWECREACLSASQK